MSENTNLSDWLMNLRWCPECGADMRRGNKHFCEACQQRVPVPSELSERIVELIVEKVRVIDKEETVDVENIIKKVEERIASRREQRNNNWNYPRARDMIDASKTELEWVLEMIKGDCE